jgi:DNA replication and repair protein RecF
MSLISVEINQFRNLQHIHIQPDAGLNIISGVNAAGKTSFLESLFYLSYGRSFRSSQTRDLIFYQQDYFRLLAKIKTPEAESIIGIEKSLKNQIIRVNQRDIHKISDLAALFPVIALHPDSHQLITSGPEYRRQYIDWGVFHVEHSFIGAWKSYRKALAQRNAALRQQQANKMCTLWDPILVESAQLIEQARRSYMQKLIIIIEKYAQYLFPKNRISLQYKQGWDEDVTYQTQLELTLARDKDKGYTQSGSHRADIKIRLDNKSAHTAISRGQQKKLVALLKLAQLELFIQLTNRTCVLLYDDLPAELDRDNRGVLMELLSGMSVQLFVSTIEPELLDISFWNTVKMFHVEHGAVSEIMT